MSARQIWESYLRRTGAAEMYGREPVYFQQLNQIRDLMTRLEVILEDEEIAPEQRERILRSVVYGTPTVAEAEQRLNERNERLLQTYRAGVPLANFPPGLR
ncbi:hypothetical protein [Streptosporangium sp. NPDC002524]|uniref:hypothetical protein n=1 Tax=Streptosporangium sp. NPDC002524 TaxID=3154537 RepID=UPI0033203AF3